MPEESMDDTEKTAPEVGLAPFTGIAPIGRTPTPEAGTPDDRVPLDPHKAAMRRLADSTKGVQWLQDAIDGTVTVKEETRLSAIKFVVERGYGRLPTVIEGGDAPVKMIFELSRERKDEAKE